MYYLKIPGPKIFRIGIAVVLAAGISLAFAMKGGPTTSFVTDPEDPGEENCINQMSGFQFYATPTTVTSGQAVTLHWALEVPAQCAAIRKSINNQLVSGSSGSIVFTPNVEPYSTSNYRFMVNWFGTIQTLGEVNVTTTGYALPVEQTVYINGSTPAWRDLLARALAVGGKTVVLAPDVDIDMTGHATLTVGPNTKLTSNGARDARNLGPRIRTSDRPKPLIEIRCYPGWDPDINVEFDGFRLQGPHWDPVEGDANLEMGIKVHSCRKVSISNMEISGWSGQGIYVVDEDMDNIKQPEDVKIFENFFHHNQHEDGNGYGVEAAGGANILIERNVFDFNRHAIAAKGGWSPGAGYIARHNLVLKGGGYHKDETWPYLSWQTHQFDVHGTTDCGPLVFNAEYSCGEAGIYFEMTDNAFQYSRTNSLPFPNPGAIKIRGNPLVNPLVSRNVFAYGSQSDAIKQNGLRYESAITTPIFATANRYGLDTFSRYGVCDFDADGIDDLFLATGATWWWSSGGEMHWKFLKAATETLDQVGLGDFDGDGKCDVFASNPFQISSGGTNAWAPLPGGHDAPFATLRFGDFNGDRITDIFHRDGSGQWWIVSPGIHTWEAAASSGLPLSDLRFGFFNKDKITDVLSVQGGKWSASWGARSAWEKINNYRGESLGGYLIGDINNNGIDDLLRYRWLKNQSPIPGGIPGGDMGIWEVTWDGRGSNWIRLNTYTAPANQFAPNSVPGFLGRFKGQNSAQGLLTIPDADRLGKIYDPVSGKFIVHSLYAY